MPSQFDTNPFNDTKQSLPMCDYSVRFLWQQLNPRVSKPVNLANAKSGCD